MKTKNNSKAFNGKVATEEQKLKHDEEMFEHLWKRTLHMERGEYWWFKTLSKVPRFYHKPLSAKQRESLMPIWNKYKGMKEKYLKEGETFDPETRKISK